LERPLITCLRFEFEAALARLVGRSSGGEDVVRTGQISVSKKTPLGGMDKSDVARLARTIAAA